MATVLGAVEEGNTANRGGCIQHVSVSCARLSHHTHQAAMNPIFFLSKNEQLFVGMQKISDAINLCSFARDEFSHSINNLVPQFGRLQTVGIVFHSILH